MAITNAHKVADFFVRFGHEHGDPLTNLKLQKLLYYAQGWYLALNDSPLFSEPLEAWVHGPVQPDVYRRFKVHRWNPIPDDVGEIHLPEEVTDHLEEVMEVYGRFSAYDLERMTHREAPWRRARGDLPMDEPSSARISLEDMKAFFKEQLRGQEGADSR